MFEHQGVHGELYDIKFSVEPPPIERASEDPTPSLKTLFPRQWLKDPGNPHRPGRKKCAPTRAVLIPLGMTGVAKNFELRTSMTSEAPGHIINPVFERDQKLMAKFAMTVGGTWMARVSEAGESTLHMIAFWPDPAEEANFFENLARAMAQLLGGR